MSGHFCFGDIGVIGVHFGNLGKMAPFGRKFYILPSAPNCDKNIFPHQCRFPIYNRAGERHTFPITPRPPRFPTSPTQRSSKKKVSKYKRGAPMISRRRLHLPLITFTNR